MSSPHQDLGDDPFKEYGSDSIDASLSPAILADDGPISTHPTAIYKGAVSDSKSYTESRLNNEVDRLSGSVLQMAHTTAVAMPASESTQNGQQVKSTSKFWTLEFYQQFFDVTTQQVLIRISNTLVPINPPDFLMERNWHYSTRNNTEVNVPSDAINRGDLIIDGIRLSRKSDLYGPFWISTTLWMLLGIISNIMSHIAYNRSGASNKNYSSTYDFSVVTVACVVIYLYCFGFGAIVWGIMQWKNLPVTLTDTLCLYGYSIFIFILAAILCVIPVSLFQWLVVMLFGVWSTVFLVGNFWFLWKKALDRKSFLAIVGLVTLFHMSLSLSFKFYFMKYSY